MVEDLLKFCVIVLKDVGMKVFEINEVILVGG